MVYSSLCFVIPQLQLVGMTPPWRVAVWSAHPVIWRTATCFLWLQIPLLLTTGRNRFDSFRFRTVRQFIGSVRFRKIHLPVQRGSAWAFQARQWLGPVRFGSFPRPVSAGSGIKRFGSVQFGRFGSVSYFHSSDLSVYTNCLEYSMPDLK